MRHAAAFESRPFSSRESTLGRWVGFRVDTPDGRLGTVVAELRHGHCGRPACIVVRRGMFCEEHVLVWLVEIEHVLPAERRIVVRAAAWRGLDEALLRRVRRAERAARVS